MKRIWNVKFSHTHREGNTVANWFIDVAYKVTDLLRFYQMPHVGCMNLLWADFVGDSYPVAISL